MWPVKDRIRSRCNQLTDKMLMSDRSMYLRSLPTGPKSDWYQFAMRVADSIENQTVQRFKRSMLRGSAYQV